MLDDFENWSAEKAQKVHAVMAWFMMRYRGPNLEIVGGDDSGSSQCQPNPAVRFQIYLLDYLLN